jgi:hypothetical protein
MKSAAMLFPLGLPPDDVRGGKPTTSADLEAVAPLFHPLTRSFGPLTGRKALAKTIILDLTIP